MRCINAQVHTCLLSSSCVVPQTVIGLICWAVSLSFSFSVLVDANPCDRLAHMIGLSSLHAVASAGWGSSRRHKSTSTSLEVFLQKCITLAWPEHGCTPATAHGACRACLLCIFMSMLQHKAYAGQALCTRMPSMVAERTCGAYMWQADRSAAPR